MTHHRKISVIGLGYVGLSTAIAFSKIERVIGLDKNPQRIEEIKNNYDKNNELSKKEMEEANVYYTTDYSDLKNADFHIITVPTPLDNSRRPNFMMLLDATENLGKHLKKGDIVVYESSVYPGATEEKCIPVLERSSKLIFGKDFTVGYSPERINPADKEHTFENIIKIVSGSDTETLEIISAVYKSVIKAGVYPVSTIRIAEAAKIIENTQRDVNIALLNDIAIMLHALNIDTREVLAAMKTKWNCVPFEPGLVGGHCIGVNSYYLMFRAEESSYYSQIIMSSRHVNEHVASFISIETIKNLILLGIAVKRARIVVLGLSYKENCSDVRDTSVINIVKSLKTFGAEVLVHDPIADPTAANYEYNIQLKNWDDLNDIDAIVLAVAHNFYVEMDRNTLIQKLRSRCLIMDTKGIFDPKDFMGTGIVLWRL